MSRDENPMRSFEGPLWARLSEFQVLRGIRRVGSAKGLESVGHLCALAGRSPSARHTEETDDYQIDPSKEARSGRSTILHLPTRRSRAASWWTLLLRGLLPLVEFRAGALRAVNAGA